MPDIDHERLAELFDVAVSLAPSERAAYLDRTCADDPCLRAELEALLSHDLDRPSVFLEPPFQAEPDRTELEIGTTINDRYIIRERIGEGGMGLVYIADQIAPLRRQVALKVIKPGMDTRQVIRRFESERQLLGILNHPNIASVYDAGVTEDRRPYFVMELAAGLPITTFCDHGRMPIDDRLRLFATVCDAMQHAHEKGVIHRDLKPTNVLVTMQDGRPVAKVIDFGIAKAVTSTLSAQTMFTDVGHLVGTPEYMSPEQASMTEADVDTRSDIYSLGVVLYELLCGTPPHDPTSMRTSSFHELCRRIREDDAPRPSTRLAELSSTEVDALADRRTLDGSSLMRAIRGDLDWITMRAMEKDRDRRYDSAAALATEIRRHLAHEPVLAGPPGIGYVTRKFVRRHRTLVVGGTAAALAILIGAIFSTVFIIRESRAQAIADERREVTTMMTEFMGGLLGASDPRDRTRSSIASSNMRVIDVLDNSTIDLAEHFKDAPHVEAAARHTLGVLYMNLDRLDEATEHLSRACDLFESSYGPTDRSSLHSMTMLARVRHRQGDLDGALQLQETARQRWTDAYGEHDPDTIACWHYLARIHADGDHLDVAEDCYRRSMRLTREFFPDNTVEIAYTWSALGSFLVKIDRADEARPLLEDALPVMQDALGPDHIDILDVRATMAAMYAQLGEPDRARTHFEQTLAGYRAVLGDEHINTLTVMNNLARHYRANGQADAALPLYLEVVAIARRVHGDDSPTTAQFMSNAGVALRNAGRLDEAIDLLTTAHATNQRLFPDGNPNRYISAGNLARTLTRAQRYDEAEPLAREAYDGLQSVYGDVHRMTRISASILEDLYTAWGRTDDAAHWTGVRERIEEALDS